MRNNRRVAVMKFEGLDNCYILTSACWKDSTKDFCTPVVSFFYDGGNIGAEWGAPYNPIQVWNKAEELNENTQENYFYDYVTKDSFGQWSQLAVNDNHLSESYVEGDYEHIFLVLKRWADR